MAGGTLYSGEIIHNYGSGSHLALDLSYTGYRGSSGTSSTMYYTITGRVYITKDSSGTSNYGYGTRVVLYFNGDWQSHTFYDDTFTSTLNYNSSYDPPQRSEWDISASGSYDITSGTLPLTIEVKDSGGSSSRVDFVARPSLNIDSVITSPTYNSVSASNITSSSVSLSASVNSGGASITSGGWQLSTDGGTTWTVVSTTYASASIQNLTRATTYTYRGYATNVAGTGYSSDNTFTTLMEAPIIVINSIDNITETSAVINATCTDSGGGPLIDSRLLVASDPNLVDVVYTTNALSGVVTGLTPGTTYYVLVKGANADAAGNSIIATFTTLAQPSTTAYFSEDANIVNTQATYIELQDITFKTPIGIDIDFRYTIDETSGATTHPLIMFGSQLAIYFDSYRETSDDNRLRVDYGFQRSATASYYFETGLFGENRFRRHKISWRVSTEGVGYLYIDGALVSTLDEIDTTYTDNSSYLMVSSFTTNAAIFGVKVYEYDSLVHNLIPYENGGSVGLRDTITQLNYYGNNFIYNDNSFKQKQIYLSENGTAFINVTNKLDVID